VKVRSIRFRLTAWYAGVLTAIVVALGALLFLHLKSYLENTLLETQDRRARQISDTLVANAGRTGEAYVAKEVSALLRPGEKRPLHPHHGGRGPARLRFRCPRKPGLRSGVGAAGPLVGACGIHAQAADSGRPGAADRLGPR